MGRGVRLTKGEQQVILASFKKVLSSRKMATCARHGCNTILGVFNRRRVICCTRKKRYTVNWQIGWCV